MIRKGKDDRWHVRRQVNGRDIRKSFPKRVQAEDYETQLIMKQRSGVSLTHHCPPIEDILALFQTHLEDRASAGKRSINTVDRWKCSIKHWKLFFSFNQIITVDDLSYSSVDSFCSIRRRQCSDKAGTKPISEQTIYNDFRCLHSALNWAFRWRHIPENPIAHYPFDQGDIIHKVPDLPSPADIQSIFDHLPDEDTRKAFYFILATGCRYSDMETLEADDISPTALIKFWRSVKGRRKHERYAPLPDLPYSIPTAGRIFDRDGYPWKEKTLLDRVQKASAKAGASKINIHSLRRAHATYELALGRKSVGHLMESCGWRSYAVFERYIQEARKYDIEEYLPQWPGTNRQEYPQRSDASRQNPGKRRDVIKFKQVI